MGGLRTFMQETTQVDRSWCYFCDGTEMSGVTPTTLLSSYGYRLVARDPSRVVGKKPNNTIKYFY